MPQAEQNDEPCQHEVEEDRNRSAAYRLDLHHLHGATLERKLHPDRKVPLIADVRELDRRLNDLLTDLRGDAALRRRRELTPPSISERVAQVVEDQWEVTSPPTQTQHDAYRFAATEFAEALATLREIAADLEALEATLEAAGAPWTPGRIPDWEIED